MIRVAVERQGAGFQERWIPALERHGASPLPVDLRSPGILDILRGVDAVMWHPWHHAADLQLARRLLPILERELHLPVFPNLRALQTFDDKIAQHYLFQAHQLPTPKTWVFWTRAEAGAWAAQARFPVVAKLASGAGSSQVRLIQNAREAGQWINAAFSRSGILAEDPFPRTMPAWEQTARRLARRLRHAACCAGAALTGRYPPLPREQWVPQKDVVYFQEFLAGNTHDTRVTVIGNRAFGYRRWNRPGDFRASGSGSIDHTPEAVDPRCLRLALEAAARIGNQSLACDILQREGTGDPLLVEVSFGYVSRVVQECPGFWTPDLTWVPGSVWPEDAHVEDMLALIQQRRRSHTP
ncbi:MAG TPA: hypothetical protein PKE12_09000 [Kiritimatiellia bacterium]|nr:hypothetical protein [Kiritimatiellia bacterium]